MAADSPPRWCGTSDRARPNLHASQRAEQAEVVEVAEVTDAKCTPGELAESDPQRQIEPIQHGVEQSLRGVLGSGRHQHGRQHGAVFRRLEADHLEPPRRHGATRRLGVARVARVHDRQPLLAEHAQRLAQAVEQIRGRRVREDPLLVGGQHRGPVPEAPGQPRARVRGQRPVADGIEAEARRQHQSLL